MTDARRRLLSASQVVAASAAVAAHRYSEALSRQPALALVVEDARRRFASLDVSFASMYVQLAVMISFCNDALIV